MVGLSTVFAPLQLHLAVSDFLFAEPDEGDNGFHRVEKAKRSHKENDWPCLAQGIPLGGGVSAPHKKFPAD